MSEFPCLARVRVCTCRDKAEKAYPWSIRRLAIVLVVLSDFVEVVLVQLSNETGKVAMFEMLGQNGFREPFVLHRRQREIA